MLRRKDALCMPDNVGKNTAAHSEYVILTAFPQQRWLGERAKLLRYTCIACLVECHLMITLNNKYLEDKGYPHPPPPPRDLLMQLGGGGKGAVPTHSHLRH